MQRLPKVSIITPFFNSPYFSQTKDSVLNQTYENRERIIVNDFAGQGEICQKTALDLNKLFKNEQRVKVVHNNKNIGIPATRNRALEHTSGEYIALLDHDDVWLPRKIQTQVEFMHYNEHIGLFGTATSWIDGKNKLYRAKPSFYGDTDMRENILYEGPCCTSSVMIRKELLEIIGGFDEQLPYVDDRAMMLAASKHTQMANDREYLTQYRWHDENTTKQYPYQMSINAYRAIQKYGSHIPGYYPAVLYHAAKCIMPGSIKNLIRPHLYAYRDKRKMQ